MDEKAHFGSQRRVERGNLVIEGIPDIPDRIRDRLHPYQNTRSASLRDWLPDGGGILISTRFGQTSQIHLVATPGGARRQITFFDEPVGGAWTCPDRNVRGFLFTRDVGGSEFHQIFWFDLTTGAWRMLTDGQSLNDGVRWDNHGGRFAYHTTVRNGRAFDLHVRGIDGDPTAVLERDGEWWPVDWSPDDTTLLVERYVSINESYLYLLDVATTALTQLNPTDEAISYGAAWFARDGRGIYFASDQDSEFRRLRYCDLATGAVRSITDHIPWDVEALALSHNGSHVAFTVNEEGISRLHVLDARSGEPLDLPEAPMGVIAGLKFSPDDAQVGMTINGPQVAGDVYSLHLSDGRLSRWTCSEAGGLDTQRFAAPELIHYETFDEVEGQPRKIPALYYRPAGNGPFPVLINIHGGPESQARPRFSTTFQYYVVEIGIALFEPNVRGSSGYGKSYLLLDNALKREDSVKDIGALLDWIAARPELDSDRVAVMGGSYGGYMVLACMTHYNDRLRAGVELFGISNFVTFLENTQAYRRDQRRTEYGDEREPAMRAFLTRISPMTNAAKIQRPLLVAQGLNDPRAPVTESEQMVEIIRRNGGTVAYVLARDEGHGFRKKRNLNYVEQAAALFLETYLM